MKREERRERKAAEKAAEEDEDHEYEDARTHRVGLGLTIHTNTTVRAMYCVGCGVVFVFCVRVRTTRAISCKAT